MVFPRFAEKDIVDYDIFNDARQRKINSVHIWSVVSTSVVIGRTTNIEDECRINEIKVDNIPMLQRLGGGCAVILSKGMLVFSIIGVREENTLSNYYFSMMNVLIIRLLEEFGISGVKEDGISDICIGDRKIVGSSLHMSKEKFFYQASLLCDNDISLFSRYLKHPPKEPLYRRGRTHSDFVTNLKQEGYCVKIEDIRRKACSIFNEKLS